MSDVEPTSVRVSWQAAENADRYNITLSKMVGQGLCPSDSHTVSVVTSNLSVLVGNTTEGIMLRPHTKYYITVGAMNDATKSTQYGIPVTFITNQTSEFHTISGHYSMTFSHYKDASVSPRNVRVIAVSSVVLSVQWDGLTPCIHVNGHIVKYRIQYTSESSGVTQSVDKSGAWNVMKDRNFLSGLIPNTNYTIKVAAVNEKGHVGLYSKPIVKSTKELGVLKITVTYSMCIH